MGWNEPKKPTSNSEYQAKKQRFRRIQFALRIVLAAAALFVIFAPRGNWTKFAAVLLVFVGLAVLAYELIAGTSYFLEKSRQGYKVGPYTDTSRAAASVEDSDPPFETN